jgi:hypothetical protein
MAILLILIEKREQMLTWNGSEQFSSEREQMYALL